MVEPEPERMIDEDEDRPCTIGELPETALLQIFGYMSPPTWVDVVARVCRQWKRLAEDHSLWRDLELSYDASEERKWWPAASAYPLLSCCPPPRGRAPRRHHFPKEDMKGFVSVLRAAPVLRGVRCTLGYTLLLMLRTEKETAALVEALRDAVTRCRPYTLALSGLPLHHLLRVLAEPPADLRVLSCWILNGTSMSEEALWELLSRMPWLQELHVEWEVDPDAVPSVPEGPVRWVRPGALRTLSLKGVSGEVALACILANRDTLVDVYLRCDLADLRELAACRRLHRLTAPAAANLPLLAASCPELRSVVLLGSYWDTDSLESANDDSSDDEEDLDEEWVGHEDLLQPHPVNCAAAAQLLVRGEMKVSLRELRLEGFNGTHLAALLPVVRWLRGLRELSLSGCELHPDQWEVLAEAVQRLPALAVLEIGSMDRRLSSCPSGALELVVDAALRLEHLRLEGRWDRRGDEAEVKRLETEIWTLLAKRKHLHVCRVDQYSRTWVPVVHVNPGDLCQRDCQACKRPLSQHGWTTVTFVQRPDPPTDDGGF